MCGTSLGVIVGYMEQSKELKSYFHCTIKTCKGVGRQPWRAPGLWCSGPPCAPGKGKQDRGGLPRKRLWGDTVKPGLAERAGPTRAGLLLPIQALPQTPGLSNRQPHSAGRSFSAIPQGDPRVSEPSENRPSTQTTVVPSCSCLGVGQVTRASGRVGV